MNLYELPEGCIANALSLTSPRDACRLSLVGSTFRSAAQSDAVWERFLPPDYLEILSQSSVGADLLRSFASKKELYFYLCDHPILIDGCMKSFSLEKGSGKKCYMLAPRDLKIVWSDTPCYWQWVSLPESRFSEVAELVDVCWLEICGKINTSMLSPITNYAAYLVFAIKSGAYGLDFFPVEASVGISGEEKGRVRSVYLDPNEEDEEMEQQDDTPPDQVMQYPQWRGDRWREVELGEFYVQGGQDVELEMSLLGVEGGNWKRGLIVEGIEIRPKVGK